MVCRSFFAAARRLRAVCILACLFPLAIEVNATADISPTAPASANAPATVKTANKPITKPLWSELNPAQQLALAPLAVEWDRLDPIRKKKWLEISGKFSTMKPDEQVRLQERMRDWAKLTPEQRRVARESFSRTKKLAPDQKSAQWQQYQQLSEEQKKKLATDSASKKHVANLPSPHTKGKTVPPIKSTPKPVLEQSVTPQAATQSGIQPAPQPTKN